MKLDFDGGDPDTDTLRIAILQTLGEEALRYVARS
jgi:hypothetical protein